MRKKIVSFVGFVVVLLSIFYLTSGDVTAREELVQRSFKEFNPEMMGLEYIIVQLENKGVVETEFELYASVPLKKEFDKVKITVISARGDTTVVEYMRVDSCRSREIFEMPPLNDLGARDAQ